MLINVKKKALGVHFLFFLGVISLLLPLTACAKTSDSKITATALNLPAGVGSQKYNWNEESKTITFVASTSFSNQANVDDDKEGFYWIIPSAVSRVVIKANVTITGGFRTTGAVSIDGEDRQSSKIYGTATKAWARGLNQVQDAGTSCNNGGTLGGDDRVDDCNKWRYGAVSTVYAPNASYTVNLRNLTLENSRTYAITSFAQPVIADNIHILNSRAQPDSQSNSDGFGGGPGSILRNSRIDTWDDAVKAYYDVTVENVTIVHNLNGAPFQFGWGSDAINPTLTIKNTRVIANNANNSNLALFSAALSSGTLTRTVSISGLVAVYGGAQKLLVTNNLPLFYLDSAGASATISSQVGANINLSAPAGKFGGGAVTLNICGSSAVSGAYTCGTPALVTGCGF